MECAGVGGLGVGVGRLPGGVQRDLPLLLLDVPVVFRDFGLLHSILFEVGPEENEVHSQKDEVEPT